jgi:hypothetical protein
VAAERALEARRREIESEAARKKAELERLAAREEARLKSETVRT